MCNNENKVICAFNGRDVTNQYLTMSTKPSNKSLPSSTFGLSEEKPRMGQQGNAGLQTAVLNIDCCAAQCPFAKGDCHVGLKSLVEGRMPFRVCFCL